LHLSFLDLRSSIDQLLFQRFVLRIQLLDLFLVQRTVFVLLLRVQGRADRRLRVVVDLFKLFFLVRGVFIAFIDRVELLAFDSQ